MKNSSFRSGMGKLMNQGYSKHNAYKKMRALSERKPPQLPTVAKLAVIGIIILSLLNANQNIINIFIRVLSDSLAGAITSAAAGSLIEKFGGVTLKKVAINVQILKVKFSITAFALAVLVVEYFLF